MTETVLWGLAGIIVTIVFAFFGAKKWKLWGNEIEVNGNVKGDVFIGSKKTEK